MSHLKQKKVSKIKRLRSFEFLKADLDIFPLMERKTSTIRGLVFILFISLIVRLAMRRMLSESGLNRKYSMDKVFLELEKLQMMEIDGKMVERERTKNRKTSWRFSSQLHVPKYAEFRQYTNFTFQLEFRLLEFYCLQFQQRQGSNGKGTK